VETVLPYVQAIALISLTALCTYLIVVLSSLRRDLAEFMQRAKPVLDNLAFITERLKCPDARRARAGKTRRTHSSGRLDSWSACEQCRSLV
jgi:hypothetical protein